MVSLPVLNSTLLILCTNMILLFGLLVCLSVLATKHCGARLPSTGAEQMINHDKLDAAFLDTEYFFWATHIVSNDLNGLKTGGSRGEACGQGLGEREAV